MQRRKLAVIIGNVEGCDVANVCVEADRDRSKIESVKGHDVLRKDGVPPYLSSGWAGNSAERLICPSQALSILFHLLGPLSRSTDTFRRIDGE
jgi:hypothetical protein